jgi:hypothetical protein
LARPETLGPLGLAVGKQCRVNERSPVGSKHDECNLPGSFDNSQRRRRGALLMPQGTLRRHCYRRASQ